MRRVTQEEIANRINVTSRTIRNWEHSKPELLRLLRTAIAGESLYIDFWLLSGEFRDFILLGDLYLDFYFKFLNYLRKNAIMRSDANANDRFAIDIVKTFVIYTIQHNKEELFDSEFKLNDVNIKVFERDTSINLIFLKSNNDLSEYVLRNTIDDFETLVRDCYGKDSLLVDAMAFSILYIVFKYEGKTGFSDKMKIYHDLKNQIGINETLYIKSKRKLLDTYFEVKDTFVNEQLNLLVNEPDFTSYIPKRTNDFQLARARIALNE